MQLRDNYKYEYISTATTTQVASGQGQLVRIIVGTTAAGAITVVDATSGSTPVIATLKSSIAEGTYEFGINFFAGLRVITAAGSLITVVYSNISA
jgi:hypothetical protein